MSERWNPSTIDPKHDRKRRHHRARAARSRCSASRFAALPRLGPLRVEVRRGLRQQLVQRERPPGCGSVAPGPRAGRMQQEAVGGDPLVLRDSRVG